MDFKILSCFLPRSQTNTANRDLNKISNNDSKKSDEALAKNIHIEYLLNKKSSTKMDGSQRIYLYLVWP